LPFQPLKWGDEKIRKNKFKKSKFKNSIPTYLPSCSQVLRWSSRTSLKRRGRLKKKLKEKGKGEIHEVLDIFFTVV
jgi:hypothetical protein